MLTSFQKLCIRPEPGFVYDHNSMVKLTDGGTFTELLSKVTSKCDTSLLLLSSHKGKIRDFSIKIIGIKTPQAESSSVTSAVLSSFKKGLSFLNGSNTSSEVEPPLSDLEQVAQAWQESEHAGYHGMHVITLLDNEVMPDNECRKLYNLHQFMTVTLQSINAYYMFQKPDVAFVYDAGFNTQELKEAYPDADTFGIALMWRFANDPGSTVPGRIRPTPIIRTSIRSEATSASPGLSRLSLFDDSPAKPLRPVSSSTTTVTTTTRKVTKLRGSPLVQHESFSESQSPVKTSVRTTTTTSSQSASDESNSSRESSPEATFATSRIAKKLVSPVAVQQPARNPPPPVEQQLPSRSAPFYRRGTRQEVVPPLEEEDVELRRIRGTPKRQVVTRPVGRRGTKRQLQEVDDEPMDEEISFKPTEPLVEQQLQQDLPASKVTESTYVKELETRGDLELQSINLPFDDAHPSPAKPRGGRKSMVASARKSLANEWPQDDQDHMMHFFDNLNTQQSETSRVALTCKYALIQYDRDLSSKLLYQWLERTGRPVLREVTDYTLAEADQKTTVLELYRKLSDVQSEATRVSFTLKFIQAQYGVAITSKQLFGWLKEKPKKGKK